MSTEQEGEERPPKRQRTETNETNEPNDFVLDEDFHFEDGNIILVAEDTGFKVHKGVLSRHSVFFRDMFALADESASSETHKDGCKIIRLPDSKQDVVYLLQVLYDNRIPSSDDLTELSSLLRISNKYLAHNLFKRTVKILETTIPTTYEDCKVAMKTGRSFVSFDVAVAAITTGTDILLPVLFYEFSRRADPRQFNRLPTHIVANILTGIHSILNFLPAILKIIQAKTSALDTCRLLGCRSAWKEFTSSFQGYLTTPRNLFFSIYIPTVLFGEEKYVAEGECSSCKAARISLLDAEAKKVWDKLPKTYNIAGSWDELRERHTKIIEPDKENNSQ